jgi:hypothetical protein
MRAITALRCPYCHCGFDPKDEVTRCSKCRAIHHTCCWYENQHCSVYACTGAAFLVPSLPIIIQISPPILLSLLSLFPIGLSFFSPLLSQALVCSGVVIFQYMSDLISGKMTYMRGRILYTILCICNLISVYYMLIKLIWK